MVERMRWGGKPFLFSDQNLSVVCRRRCCRRHCRKLNSFSRTTWPISNKPMGDQDSSLLNEGSRPFPRLVNSNIVNLCINEFLFQNHWADCNHTWHKWVNGIQCIPVEVYILFPWGDDNAWSTFKNSSESLNQFQTNLSHNIL